MAEMKTFNGYEVVDAKARQDIASHDTRITDVDAKVDAIHIPEKVSELKNDKGYLTEHQSLDGKADKVHTHKLNEITDYKAPDLTPYATKEYVDAADKQLGLDIDNIEFHLQNIIEPTLNGKSDKGHKHTLSEITDYKAPVIPTKVSQLTNDSTYTTKEYVDDADKKIELDVTNLTYHITNVIEPSIVAKAAKVHQHTLSEISDYAAPDLSGYARKTDIPDVSKFITDIPAEYVTENELNNKGYLTSHQDISGKADKVHKHSMSDITDYEEPDLSKYALKTDIPTDYLTSIPAEYVTDVELGAKGYLTEHQDLSAYATKTFVNNAIANVDVDLTGYATKTYVSNTVNAAIDDIPAPDLSDYAKKADIPDVSDFITSIPAEYITETELNNKGYITEHQSLDNYYTKAQTDSAIGEAISGIEIPETDISGKADLVHQHSMADITDYVAPVIPSLDGYATEQYVDDAIADIDIPDTDLSNYYTKSEVDTKIEQAVIGDIDLSGYYTKGEVDTKLQPMQQQINAVASDKADKSNTYTKSEVDNAIAGIDIPEPNLSNYYTKTEVNTKIEEAVDGIDVPDVDLSNYYTKGEVQSYVRQTQTDPDMAMASDINVLKNVLDGFLLPQTNVKQYVDNAIANVPGGGGVASGVQVVYFTFPSSVSGEESNIPDNLKEIFRQYLTGENRNYVFFGGPATIPPSYQPISNITMLADSNLLYLYTNEWHYYQEEGAEHLNFLEIDVRYMRINLATGKWVQEGDKARVIKESAFNALADRVAALESIQTAEGGSY